MSKSSTSTIEGIYTDRVRYDTIIIGSGMAGLPAAIYAARFNMKVLVLTDYPGGLITTTHLVENYPGFSSISGPDLAAKFEEHAKAFGVPINVEKTEAIEKKDDYFLVKTKKNLYEAKTVILATGSQHKKLGVPGEAEFAAKGVSYCALCDGYFFKGKEVAIVGSGDSAAKDALLLTELVTKVYLIARGDAIHPEPINGDRVKANKKIEVMTNTQIVEIVGKEAVEALKLSTGKTLKIAGVFIAIGHNPRSELAEQLGVTLNKHKEIIIDKYARTNVPGVYAAGDVTENDFKQGITGAAEGCLAAFSAYNYVQQQ